MTPSVIALSGPDIRDKLVSIRFDNLDEEQPFKLWLDGIAVAACRNPDTLGRWALDAGAKECRHNYDAVALHYQIHKPV